MTPNFDSYDLVPPVTCAITLTGVRQLMPIGVEASAVMWRRRAGLPLEALRDGATIALRVRRS
jgi:hypothetical protein